MTAVELGCELRQSNLRYSSIREQFVCGIAQQSYEYRARTENYITMGLKCAFMRIGVEKLLLFLDG